MDRDTLLRIENKIDKLDSRLDSIDICQAEVRKDLNYHIKRTDILQEDVKSTKEDIKPIQTHVDMVSGGVKLVGILSLIAALINGILHISKGIK